MAWTLEIHLGGHWDVEEHLAAFLSLVYLVVVLVVWHHSMDG